MEAFGTFGSGIRANSHPRKPTRAPLRPKCVGRWAPAGAASLRRSPRRAPRDLSLEARGSNRRELSASDRAQGGELAVLLRLCCTCGKMYDPHRGGYHRADKCQACTRTYERAKSRERRASSTAVKTRDSRTWQRARALAKHRDSGRCVRCGASERLEVHHVVPIEQGGERFMLSNLVTLCRLCHEDEEHEAKARFLDTRPPTQIPGRREKDSQSRSSEIDLG
jgi:5-methylcytosine-specific restriction endonuclease McrA